MDGSTESLGERRGVDVRDNCDEEREKDDGISKSSCVPHREGVHEKGCSGPSGG